MAGRKERESKVEMETGKEVEDKSRRGRERERKIKTERGFELAVH